MAVVALNISSNPSCLLMKRSFLLLCAALLAASAPLAPAQQSDDSVPVDFFYDALSPYGDWIYTPNYGYVWQPLAAQQPGWAPYADGSWVYTDAGWTWTSNEDFGWLTYHYGRWIRMQQSWMWVPGNQWAPAWVSWRQTQGQIGWAPLPPEAAWTPNIGFGGWTDSYYDVGPAYYNFVPIAAFASSGSLRPFILDRSRNFSFYDQSANITHTSYQPNVMNHIFVGGPDPQRIDGFGGNQVRRLTLRRDEEGFRRDWLERRPGGGPPRGMGSVSRIEQGNLIVTAPSIRRDPSRALPSRVREPMHQPEIDRGWRGAGDPQSADRMRQQQRDELARTRPPNLPEKNVQPATSTLPPPAFGRVLEPHERGGSALPQHTDPRHVTEEVRPTAPLPTNTTPGLPGRRNEEQPPGIPVGKTEELGSGGGIAPQPGMPHREHHNEGQQSGMRPGENHVPPAGGLPHMSPGFPQAPQGIAPQPAVPSQNIPNTPPAMHPGFPGHQGQQPGRSPAEHAPGQQPSAPLAQPHVNPAPMPPPHFQPPPMHPMPPQGGNAPHIQPVAPPRIAPVEPPRTAPPNAQNPGGKGERR